MERDLANGQRNLEQLEQGQKELLQRIAAVTKDRTRAEQEALAATRRVADLDEKLKQFADLEQQSAQQQASKDRHAAEHKSYLQNQPLAARLPTLQGASATSRKVEAEGQTLVRQRTEQLEVAKQNYDPEALIRGQEAAAESKHKLVGDERELERGLNDLKK